MLLLRDHGPAGRRRPGLSADRRLRLHNHRQERHCAGADLLCCAVLCCAVLCCAVLCCALYCAALRCDALLR